LFRPQSGFPKANPLIMHNKWLIAAHAAGPPFLRWIPAFRNAEEGCGTADLAGCRGAGHKVAPADRL
jgi:hypothetical protein